MKYNEFKNDTRLEAYLARWDGDVTKPLLEWQRMLSEAKLSPDQINALFGGVETKMSGEKTALVKGAKIASMALPGNITTKLHDLIKDTKPVKNFDAAFEQAKTNLIAKLGGDNSKIVKYTTWMSEQAKKHPVIAGAVIGILTAATALATGGVGAGIVGALLSTSTELLKGQTLSKSLATGVGTGLVGWLAGLGITELGDWLSNFTINSTTVPGYVDLVKVTMMQETNGSFTLNIDTYMTPDVYDRVTELQELAQQAFSDGNYKKAVRIYNKLNTVFKDPEYLKSVNQILGTNKELVRIAQDGAAAAGKTFAKIAAGVQGAITASGSSSGDENEKGLAEDMQLTEADIRGIASSIANWAKTAAGSAAKQATQKFTSEKMARAWKAAGSPTDSNALYAVLQGVGIPADVLTAAYKENKIPTPRKASKTTGKPVADPANAPITVKSDDPELDRKVNDIIATKGKDAAIAYLQDLKAKAEAAAEPAAATGKDEPITVGKEKIMPTDPRYASLKKALSQKTSGAAPAATAAQPKPAAGTPDSRQAFQQRAAAARAKKARPIKEAFSMLTEAKARIDHPEDLVVDEGAAGAKRALSAMVSLAKDPGSVTIKFDGSPALIFGWDDQGFVLTDKSGFGAKGYDGMTRSPESVQAMLRGDTGRRIKDTTPDAMKVRDAYAKGIAGLYDMLKALVPKSLKGYIQGDLLWHGRPELADGHYKFGPLKIEYSIPANSDLGKQIGASKAGMVIHSMFSGRDDVEPRAIDNISSLGLNKVPGLVIVPHEMQISDRLELPVDAINKLDQAISKSTTAISGLLDDSIKSLPTLMKSYLAWKAGKGSGDYSNSPAEFLEWLDSPASKATGSMQNKVREHISNHQAGYNAVWQLISALTALKLHLKKQLDAAAAGNISAEFSGKAHPELVGKPGHEGFVADTEHGKIKLVNRPQFMRKGESGEEAALNEYASGGASAAGGVASIPNPFGFTVSRTPNLFGYIPATPKKKKAKRKTSKSR